MKLLLAWSLVVGTAACSGSNSGGGQPDASIYTGPCTATITGIDGGPYACTTTTVWTSSDNQGEFRMEIAFPAGPSGAVIHWAAEPVPRAYLSSDPGVTGGATTIVGLMMPTEWSTSLSNPTTGQTGHFDLAFAQVGSPTVTTDGNSYAVHGTLEALLVPDRPVPNNLTLSARF